MRGLPVGKPFGIPFELHWSWLPVFALLAWSLASGLFPPTLPGRPELVYGLLGAATALLFFGGVLAHELGHALVARRLGVESERIVLFFFGGVAQLRRAPASGRDEVLVALAGPLVSFALAGLCWALSALGGEVGAVAGWLARINVLMALFNLLPGFPLDGGRVLRGLVWQRTRSLETGTAVAAGVSGLVSWGMIGFAVVEVLRGDVFGGVWLAVLAFMLQGAAAAEAGQTIVQARLRDLPPVRDLVVGGWPTLTRDTPMSRVADLVRGTGRTLFPVVEDARLYGFVTADDLGRLEPRQWPWWNADRLLHVPRSDAILAPHTTVLEALQTMARLHATELPVVEGDTYLGLVSRDGLLAFARLRAPGLRGAGDAPASPGWPQGGAA